MVFPTVTSVSSVPRHARNKRISWFVTRVCAVSTVSIAFLYFSLPPPCRPFNLCYVLSIIDLQLLPSVNVLWETPSRLQQQMYTVCTLQVFSRISSMNVQIPRKWMFWVPHTSMWPLWKLRIQSCVCNPVVRSLLHKRALKGPRISIWSRTCTVILLWHFIFFLIWESTLKETRRWMPC